MVLIIAACLLGLISNTTLSNNSTQTHDLFRLYMIRSKQLFLNNWLWAWNIYLFIRSLLIITRKYVVLTRKDLVITT